MTTRQFMSKYLYTLGCLLCFVGGAVAAESTIEMCVDGSTSPATLGTTMAIDSAMTQKALITPGVKSLRKRRTKLYISPVRANRLLEAGSAILIDPRSGAQEEGSRIPGTLTIPGYQIKTKRFLRNRKLLLVNDGFSYRELEELVERLGKSGLKNVSIIEGGLPAWQRDVGPLTGAVGGESFQHISAAEFIREQVFDHWILVVIGAKETAPVHGLPDPVVLAPDIDARTLRKRLNGLLEPKDGNLLKPLVLVSSADGSGYERIEMIMKDQAPWNLLFLTGGLAAYAQQQTRMEAMWDRNAHRIGDRTASCGTRR
ncbi:MAG: rhodanese-like domain-containing protein [Gammaproteobacteria bacterium]|nr:rhodanese-like domain-containing protein [Gammaproteobacteria bacterium]